MKSTMRMARSFSSRLERPPCSSTLWFSWKDLQRLQLHSSPMSSVGKINHACTPCSQPQKNYEMTSDFFARGSGNNGTTVWQRYVDVTFLVANCIILLGISLVGIGANIFVTWAVYHQKTLRTWNNALLVNLAVVDLLRCAVDCPIILVIVLTVHQQGQAGGVICTVQMASFSFSCCIQLVTLACISAERYQAIAFPFKIAERKKRIIVFIPLTWAFAILVAAVCVAFVQDSPVYVKCRGSLFRSAYNYDAFGLYVLIPLWTACFALIIGFYSRIFVIVTAHSRKIFDKGVNLPAKKEKVAEAKPAEDIPESQPDKKQITVQEEKVDAPKSTASNMDATGAPEKLAETVSAVKAPHHDEKVSKPTTDTDKPPDETLQKQLKPAHKDTKQGDIQEQLPNGDRETHRDNDKVPGKGTRDKIQIQESKSPASPVAVVAAPEGQVPPRPCKELGGPDETSVLPLMTDLKQRKPDDQVVAAVAAPEGPVVPPSPCAVLPSKEPGGPDDKTPVLPLLKQEKQEKPDDQVAVAVVAVAVTAADPGDNKEELCMVSFPRKPPAPDAGAAAAAGGEGEGAVCMMPSRGGKDRGNKKKESKLAKRSGYIILTFLLFWLPLITTIVVNVLTSPSSHSETRILQDVEVLFTSIACLTSLSDPIIYAAVNPQFRTEFYRLRNKLKAFWKNR
ncbi:hypothetical protein CRUP_036913 [Coryphaenoides rupestris]|nr:hypothetical protein CRUP_036913 [Coryphaenoides rupestris]